MNKIPYLYDIGIKHVLNSYKLHETAGSTFTSYYQNKTKSRVNNDFFYLMYSSCVGACFVKKNTFKHLSSG